MDIKQSGAEEISEESGAAYDPALYAEREAIRLELAVNHACSVAAAARSGMKNGVTIRFMSVKLIDREEFLTMPRKRLFGGGSRRADTPDKWFRYSYNKLRLCNIKVMLPTESDGGGADNEKISLVCFYENGSAAELVPEWSYNAQSGRWSVLYSERELPDASAAKARYSDNTAEFRGSLCGMSDIVNALGEEFSECCAELRGAVFELDKHTSRHSDSDPETGRGAGIPMIRYPVLPQPNAALYEAAQRSPAITGELYERMLSAAAAAGREEELSALAAELTRQRRLAMLYAVNES